MTIYSGKSTITGFTGSRHGMTPQQLAKAEFLLKDTECLHHGDCIGADKQIHDMGLQRNLVITVHPPDNPRYRAFCEKYTYLLPTKPYLDRNRSIVFCCDWLLATPAEMEDPGHGGTWYTIRYAKQVGKPITIVFPDGTIDTVEGKRQ